MRKVLKIVGTTAAVVIAAVVTVGTINSYIDRGHQRDDFRDDLVAMDFKLLPTPENELNPNWNNVQRGSKLRARVIVECWVVELERQEGEERLLPSIQGRAIEMIVVKEIHLRSIPFERAELDIKDFNQPLNPGNVKTYLTDHKGTYPCRTDLHQSQA